MSGLTVRLATPADELEVSEIDRLATADLLKVYQPTQAAWAFIPIFGTSGLPPHLFNAWSGSGWIQVAKKSRYTRCVRPETSEYLLEWVL